MDLVILIVILTVIVLVFKRFSSFVYFVAIIDILLKILTFIKYNLNIAEVSNFIATYFPESIPDILGKYSSGIFYTLLIWGYIIIYIIFLTYIFRTFLKKK
jgi:hypothetical protein